MEICSDRCALTGTVRCIQGPGLERGKPARNAFRVGTIGAEGTTSRRAGENGDDEGAEGDELNHTAEGEHLVRKITRDKG